MSARYRSSRPATIRILPESFDLEGATALGGLNRLHHFLRRYDLAGELRRRFRPAKAAWAEWPLDRVLGVLLDVAFAGVSRLYHYQELEAEPLLCTLHRVERLPDLTTLYRDLRRFADPALTRRLGDLLAGVVSRGLAGQPRVVLDIDSMVNTLYGTQEGAALGPNPHKPGRPSYHPLLARDRVSDLIVHQQLRTGDSGTATDIVPFLHRTIDLARAGQPTREILARLDSGFEGEAALAVLERRRVGYVVKMRATAALAAVASTRGASAWHAVELEGEGEVQVTAFVWWRRSWSRPRVVVALRKRELESVQGRLFNEHGWSHSLFVTDRGWAPEEVARFYDKRADVERTVCELRNDLAIDHVPSACFAANAADFGLKVLARNLLVLYRDHGLKLAARERVMTLRRRFLWIAGRIVSHAGKLWLRLAAGHPLAARPAFVT
ncbi:MAG: IS1380 family transposase [Candidatus Eisenbacteria bacterium]|nr:IS1380 family transposase [Candidatus Eisenbacteria bacterium]